MTDKTSAVLFVQGSLPSGDASAGDIAAEALARAEADSDLLALANEGDVIRLTFVSGTADAAVYEVYSGQASLTIGFNSILQFDWPGTNTVVAPTCTIGGVVYTLRSRSGAAFAVGEVLNGEYIARVAAGGVLRILNSNRIADVAGLGTAVSNANSAVQPGDDVSVLAETATAKILTDAERTKLAGIATGATANDSDAALRDRNTHTGTQPIASVSGLQTALDGKATAAQGALADTAVQPGDPVSVLSETAAAKIMTAEERVAIAENETDIVLLQAVQQVLARIGFFPIGENNLGIVYGVGDEKNRLLYGLRPSGSAYEGSVQRLVLGENNLDLLSGVVDADDRILHGVRRNGGYVGAGLIHDPLFDNNLDLVGHVVVDMDDRVVFGARADGSLLAYVVTVNTRWEMFQLTGQSLAEGGANAAITTDAPYDKEVAAKFANGPVGKQTEVIGPGLVALAEQVNETICTGMARRVLADHPDTRMLLAGQAWGGKTIAEISLGAPDGTYEKMLTQLDLAAALAPGAVARAVGMINGEADGIISTLDFDLALEDYRRQYAADVAERLGQAEAPYLITCQTSSVAGYRGGSIALRDSFTTPFAQLRAALSFPRVILVGPKYHLSYVDHSHIDALSTRLHGEKYGQVWRQLFLSKQPWLPVHAKSVLRDNDAVVLNLHSPVSMPIEIDNISVTDPGNLGFNLLDAGGVAITDVTQTGDYQITVQCSGNVPDGSRLSYAFHNGIAGTSGWNTGARGCIRDSDAIRSIYTGNKMPNWLCSFQADF